MPHHIAPEWQQHRAAVSSPSTAGSRSVVRQQARKAQNGTARENIYPNRFVSSSAVQWFTVVFPTSVAVGSIVIALSAFLAWIRRPPRI
jgi:hypothetical protein